MISNLSDLSVLEAAWENEATAGAEHVREAGVDLNLYLGTAQRLLVGFDDSGPSSDLASPVHWFRAAKDHSQTTKPGLYGDGLRFEDMTLFTPRGHDTNSKVLTAYLQGFLWLSRAQFQLGYAESTSQSDRELRAAILLALQVCDRNLLDEWQELESFLQSLTGQSLSLCSVRTRRRNLLRLGIRREVVHRASRARKGLWRMSQN